MLEIRFHGRGGQGTVVATILLAKAFFQAGYYVQSFPVFGVERRGAPVEAYLRLDEKEIWVRSNVYAPDHVVVLDRTLLQNVDVLQGLKPGGWILINAPYPPPDLGRFSGFRLAFVDATRIALYHQLGTRTHPIANTAVFGGLCPGAGNASSGGHCPGHRRRGAAKNRGEHSGGQRGLRKGADRKWRETMTAETNHSKPVSLFIPQSYLSTEGNRTGSWRFLRPRYDEKTAPCGAACPAGEDIGRIEMLTSQGQLKEAWETILLENPFPAVCGRVCYHPCETVCNRGPFDETVAISIIERFLPENAARYDLKPTLPRGDLQKTKDRRRGRGSQRSGRRLFSNLIGVLM